METNNKHEYVISNFSVWRKTKDFEDKNNKSGTVEIKNEYSYEKMDYEDIDILKSYEELHFGNGF
jgi:ribosomal protein S18